VTILALLCIHCVIFSRSTTVCQSSSDEATAHHLGSAAAWVMSFVCVVDVICVLLRSAVSPSAAANVLHVCVHASSYSSAMAVWYMIMRCKQSVWAGNTVVCVAWAACVVVPMVKVPCGCSACGLLVARLLLAGCNRQQSTRAVRVTGRAGFWV
jgi:hypothetical protein